MALSNQGIDEKKKDSRTVAHGIDQCCPWLACLNKTNIISKFYTSF